VVKRLTEVVRETLKDVASTAGIPVLLLLTVVVVGLKYVDPAPPDRIVVSTGAGEGAYQAYAEQYRSILARDGITLEMRASEGSVENLNRLSDEKSDVDLAFVQGGLRAENHSDNLVSLGSLYFEPIWIFYRHAGDLGRLSQFKGLRIAPGREGGGTRRIAMKLLEQSGVSENNSRLTALGGEAAVQALQRGEIDAAFFVGTADMPVVRKLLADPRVRPMSIDQAEAHTRILPFLHHLVLPHGAIDLEKNIPARDLDLLAVTATLVARDTLHPALTYLLLQAAREIHGDPGLFQKEHEFPADRDIDFPLSDEAERFYKSGSPYLHRVLPFWLATFVERVLVLVIPLLAVLIPFTRIVPSLYAWRVRSRIYHWYGELAVLEAQIRDDADTALREKHLERLDWIEDRVNRMRLPLAFSDSLYFLREHVELVRRKLEEKSRS
jgi:TRAP transporter TAXI family solute receptor